MPLGPRATMGDLSRDALTDLVRRFRAGDEEAFQILFGRSVGLLTRTIRSRLPGPLRRRVGVGDILQETRLVAFARRRDFEPRGPDAFANWVMGIARMKVREATRHHLRTGKRSADLEVTRGRRVDTVQHPAHGPTPSGRAMSAETAARVRRALERLPPDYQQVLRLTREEGLTLREVGQRLDRSPEAVRKLCGRALCRFKEAFEAENGADGA